MNDRAWATSCPPYIAGVLTALAMVLSASAATLDERCVGVTKFEGAMANAKSLLEMALERDQKFRKQSQSRNVFATEQESSPDARQQLLRDQREIDLDNLKLLDSIVCKFGWPAIDAVGRRASFAAFLIVQHADLAVQES